MLRFVKFQYKVISSDRLFRVRSHDNVVAHFLLFGACLSQPRLTLENSIRTSFSEEGEISVAVQASNGRSTVQDSKTVRVYGETALILIHLVRIHIQIIQVK